MNFKPCSLAQLFDPPDDYQGIFGWICGYSADAGFLEDAAERFSGLTKAQREHQGRILLAVMLDPGNPQILPSEVPAVLHLPIKSSPLPFLLLHAKVAVLGFQGAGRFLLRVIVTTGNWTRQTLEESLDLAWHVDVEDRPSESSRQDRTDLAAVWSFLTWVRLHFDTRPLDLAIDPSNESAGAIEKIATWAAQLGTRHRGYRARFFDNREASLLRQLPDLIGHHAGPTARNYLALGSGYYESTQSGAPDVPDSIVTDLKQHDLLTTSSDRNLFVNPRACQGIARGRAALENKGWKIRPARAPEYFGGAPRVLHAKFVFSCTSRGGSNNCSSPWIYLGSGNLTNPGFKQKAGANGNLEAGVILAPANLRWEQDRGSEPVSMVTNLLPIHWDDESFPLPPLQPGDDMPERDVAFAAVPVALFLWRETPDGSILVPQGGPTSPFEILDPHGRPCHRFADGNLAWNSARPRQVTIIWSAEDGPRRADVPVIDHYGRFCATDLPSLDLEDAWIQLANFPMPPDDEELAGGDATTSIDGVAASGTAAQGRSSGYPVRRMMTLVEDIARKQVNVDQADWTAWCNRLEQVLVQSKDSAVVTEFRAIGLNPLHPLLQASFRPHFAADIQTAEGVRYATALHRVTEAWQLTDRPALGVLP
ncbi:hypothetical protein ACIPUD_15540 [Bradyrhizobium sp. CAR08]